MRNERPFSTDYIYHLVIYHLAIYKPAYFLTGDGSFERQGIVGFVVDILDLRNGREDGEGYLFSADMHADRMRLDDRGVGVDIDDESGEVVSFAMDEAESVIVLPHQAQGLANLIGCADTCVPEICGEGVCTKRKYAYSNTSDLPMSHAQHIGGA